MSLYEFIFVFVWYFIEAILRNKCCKKGEFGKIDKKGDDHIGRGRGCLEKGGFKPAGNYD